MKVVELIWILTISVTYLYITEKLSLWILWFVRTHRTQCDCIIANYYRYTFTVEFHQCYQCQPFLWYHCLHYEILKCFIRLPIMLTPCIMRHRLQNKWYHKRCLLAYFEATLDFSRCKFTCPKITSPIC